MHIHISPMKWERNVDKEMRESAHTEYTKRRIENIDKNAAVATATVSKRIIQKRAR